MNELEEELIRLKKLESEIIEQMKAINITIDKRVHLLCRLEVVRYAMKPIYDDYVSLVKDEIRNKKVDE
jgi:predicted metal-binding protein